MSEPTAGSDELRLWCAVFTQKVTGRGIITRQHLFLFFPPPPLSLWEMSRRVRYSAELFLFFFHIHFTEHLIWNLFFPATGFFGVFFSSAAHCLCSFHEGAMLMAAPRRSAGVPSATASSPPPAAHQPYFLHSNSRSMPSLDYLRPVEDRFAFTCDPGRRANEPFLCSTIRLKLGLIKQRLL